MNYKTLNQEQELAVSKLKDRHNTCDYLVKHLKDGIFIVALVQNTGGKYGKIIKYRLDKAGNTSKRWEEK